MTIPLSTSTTQRASAASAPAKTKILHAMRHGITEMNVYLSKHQYGSWGFKDPLLYDTRLTPEGAAGARAAASLTALLTPQPEVLIVSPLTRALHTAELAFPHFEGPLVVEALARERVWLSSDCGRPPAELKQDFPHGRYNFDHLPEVWWYNGGSRDTKKVVLEPEAAIFKERVKKLKRYLLGRPEAVLGLVAHWGVLKELTGEDFDNCELRSFEVQEGGILAIKSQYSTRLG